MRCASIAEGGAACAQAVVDAGGAVGVVAALRAHPSKGHVQSIWLHMRWAASRHGSAACAQAVVDAGGAVVVVAALRAHPSEMVTYRALAANALGYIAKAARHVHRRWWMRAVWWQSWRRCGRTRATGLYRTMAAMRWAASQQAARHVHRRWWMRAGRWVSWRRCGRT